MTSVESYVIGTSQPLSPDGVIGLGSIVVDPQHPGRPLNFGERLPIHRSRIYGVQKQGWTVTHEQLISGRGIRWDLIRTSILSRGLDRAADSKHNPNKVYKFARIETHSFTPDDGYIQQSLLLPSVTEYIDRGKLFRSQSIYMVIGVQMAYGMTVETTREPGHILEAGSMFGEPWGKVFASGEVQLGHEGGVFPGKSSGESTESVNCYKLLKIKTRRGLEPRRNAYKLEGANSDAGGRWKTLERPQSNAGIKNMGFQPRPDANDEDTLMSSLGDPENEVASDTKLDQPTYNIQYMENPRAQSIFSDTQFTKSYTSLVKLEVEQDLVYQFLEGLFGDMELVQLYHEAPELMDRESFLRNHSRILKRYFHKFSATTINPDLKLAIQILGKHAERNQIAAETWDRLFRQPLTEQTVMEFTGSRQSNSLIKDNDIGSQSSDNSELDISEITIGQKFKATEQQLETVCEQFLSMKALLFYGPVFEEYKRNLRYFLHPPSDLHEALDSRNVHAIQRVLDNDFHGAAQGEYVWLGELRNRQCSNKDIARLLVEQLEDAPWIYFEPKIPRAEIIQPTLHVPQCVHYGGRSLSSTQKGKSSTPSFVSAKHSSVAFDEPEFRESLSEICGLAGVVPTNRDQRQWVGAVAFENNNSTALVSYYMGDTEGMSRTRPLLSRLDEALDRLCSAIGMVQSHGLCCNCYTILCFPFHDNGQTTAVELCRIDLSIAVELFQALDSLAASHTEAAVRRCKAAANTVLNIVCGEGFEDDCRDSDDNILHMCSLAVQILTVGFLSYCQAHTGSMELFFLDNPLETIRLYGAKHPSASNQHVVLELQQLSCVGDMLQNNAVLTFKLVSANNMSRVIFRDERVDLLTSPEDFIDTWGPGQYIVSSPPDKEPEILSMYIGGGIIEAVDNTGRSLHWSEGFHAPITTSIPLSPREKVIIGASVRENPHCGLNIEQCWQRYETYMLPLGTRADYWRLAEIQAGLQGSQYLTVLLAGAWEKVPGRTLKKELLSYPNDDLLQILDSAWGLEVSLCTALARRVFVREALAGIMPALIGSKVPPPPGWDTLRDECNFIEALQSSEMKDWLNGLNYYANESYKLAIQCIRYGLQILANTGIEPGSGSLVVACIRTGQAFQCLKIACEDKSFWARILADSPDCATFAYITTKCLQSNYHACRGPSSSWRGVTEMLETSVCRHILQAQDTETPWVFEDNKVYRIGAENAGLYAQVEYRNVSEGPRLIVSSTGIPRGLFKRYLVFDRGLRHERLRERQTLSSSGKQVLVSSKKLIAA
ncbi:hypothetical protein BP5796_09756 [Coleophoma crateriformis]|uniref:Uncharacterized protein n=1 Tax=Coleophoma crateriformis TaxID=565419 RepID=A0A3D8QZ05_9HELO|nr:hypothetical protein BP5796_09756 [Coleophoma crateriformis]